MAPHFWSSRACSPPSIVHLFLKPTAPFWIDERQNFGDFGSSRSSSLQSGVAVIGWSIYDFDTTVQQHNVWTSLSAPPLHQHHHHHLIHLIPQYWLNLQRLSWACCRNTDRLWNLLGLSATHLKGGDFPLSPLRSLMCLVVLARGSFFLIWVETMCK